MKVITLDLETTGILSQGVASATLCNRGHLIQPSVVSVRAIRRLEESPLTIFAEEFEGLPLAIAARLASNNCCLATRSDISDENNKALRVSQSWNDPVVEIFAILKSWAVYVVPAELEEEVIEMLGGQWFFVKQGDVFSIIVAGEPLLLGRSDYKCSLCMIEDARGLEEVEIKIKQDDLMISRITDCGVEPHWSNRREGLLMDHIFAVDHETMTLYENDAAYKVLGALEPFKIMAEGHPTIELEAGVWLLTHFE